jgi:hypothetical protein
MYIVDARIAPTAIGEENVRWRLYVLAMSSPWFVKREAEITLPLRS